MQQLKLIPERSRARVVASAPGHSFRASGLGVEGTVGLEGGRVVALEVRFPLAALDAGDPLSNRELKRFLGLERQPIASATLVSEGRIAFSIGARKMEAKVVFAGTPPEGRAAFQLTFTGLGYEPPKLLFLKVKDTLEVDVSSELAKTED